MLFAFLPARKTIGSRYISCGLQQLEQRVARLQEGVNLLADTTETGFRQVATEIERMSSVGTKAASGTSASTRTTTARPTAARLRAATRRGRSVKEIAAAEQVSHLPSQCLRPL